MIYNIYLYITSILPSYANFNNVITEVSELNNSMGFKFLTVTISIVRVLDREKIIQVELNIRYMTCCYKYLLILFYFYLVFYIVSKVSPYLVIMLLLIIIDILKYLFKFTSKRYLEFYIKIAKC